MAIAKKRKLKATDVVTTDGLLKVTPSRVKLSRTVRRRRRQNLLSVYTLGKELGRGQTSVTRLCKHNVTGDKLACKSIVKKAMTQEQIKAVDHEVEIMERLAAAENIATLKEVYEDKTSIHLVMERCAGGELFEAITMTEKGHYGEKEAASLCRKIVEGIQTCHEAGVIHGDIKLENFLFATKETDEVDSRTIKLIDFGLSTFFKPGEFFSKCVGTPLYMAPEVYRGRYSKEADLWSAGIILYVLLCGEYPFQGRTEDDFRDAVLHHDIDFAGCPWPTISNGAKDLVKKLLERDPQKRLTVHDVLNHPWIREGP